MSDYLMTIGGLTLDFATRRGAVKVLERVWLSVEPGEILGLVGESGSGKSVLCQAMLGLLGPSARVREGFAHIGGQDVLTPRGAARVRGRVAAMVFQSPRTALNPIRKTGRQIEDVLMRHRRTSRRAAKGPALEALRDVRIADPERRYHAYPFQMSGGMCQRVMIAMALACQPQLLIADEPTSGLDVTTQAAVMDLIRDLVAARGMGAVVVTHDLALAGEYCDRIAVMHAGHVVETGPVEAVLRAPRHPYTQGLIAATPTSATGLDDLASIAGTLPDLRGELPPCRFRDRCDRREGDCDISLLPWVRTPDGHGVLCRHPS